MRGRIGVGVFIVLLWGAGAAIADRAPSKPSKPGKPSKPDALSKPAFTATPGELLALGKEAPAGDWPVIVLREQSDTSYDDHGRATVRWRWVFVVRTQAGVDSWGTIHAAWRPFYQDKPVLRARVIDPAGNVAELDPSLVTDAPAIQRSSSVFSDHRHLEAPLPRLQIGAVVEEEVVTTDREPILAAGSVDATVLGNDVPTSSMVISYSAPAARKVHHVERKLPAGVRAHHQVANGRESWVYEVPALPARPKFEPAVPSDAVIRPYVGVGTAASWAAVARGYRTLVDQRIAEGPFGLPAELPRTASIETVNAITAWLHHHVRYTGIELGEASNIPWTPAETVKRGFGDCKDQATLLVTLLRQAGMRADLALLNTGPGSDVDPDLPGMGAFDHAIVRARVGTRDVWIDATEDLMRPGQAPARDQGRLALVIADDTKDLVTTPVAAPADNFVREVRTFVAAEHGPSQLTEVTRETGAFEGGLRDWVRATRADDLQNRYRDYADKSYGGTLERVTSSDAEDLATPFEVTAVVKDVRRVYTEREKLEIYLSPRAVLQKLPRIVTEKSETTRTNDFAWYMPHVYEVENRIVVPAGFTLPSVEPDRTRSIGTATFTERRRIDGQSLIITFRFETGKLRLSPSELSTLQAAVHDLSEETIHVKLDQTAFALGNAGKPREAIAECQRLIALHPTEALHHSQLATVLLRAGAGEAARREARKAVALAPADADALTTLGWTLSYDTLGRQYTYDWDRAGAVATLQKAHKLDPKHLGAAVAFARVLQRDPSGQMFEVGADLRGAASAWRDVLAIDKTDEFALALTQVLVWSGEYAEAEKVARTASETEERDKWIVAAAAGGGGGARAAIKAAGDLRSGASRGHLIDQAASLMLLLQRYDVALELFAETTALAQMPTARAAVLKKLTNHSPVKPGTADPRAAVVDLIVALVDPERKTPVFWDAALEHEFRDSTARFIPGMVRSVRTAGFLSDFMQSAATIQLEGDAGAWRATVDVGGQSFQVYLVLDRGIAKVIGGSDMLSGVGRFVLRATGAKAEVRARRLLDWIGKDAGKSTAPSALAFQKLWGPGSPTSREAISLAAAFLAGGSDPDRVIPVGLRCASTLPDAEYACHAILFNAYLVRERWADVVAQLEAIHMLRPDRAVSDARIHAWALTCSGRLDEADRLLDDVLAKDPDNRDAMLARFWVAVARGQVPEALRRADAITGDPKVTPNELNLIAWFRLSEGSDLASALDLGRKAVQAAKESSAAVNTLAAIEAEQGDLGRAIADNWKAMELRGTVMPRDADWYVVGRIAEQLGLEADAVAAYRRIARSTELLASYELAQRRLAVLRRAH